MKKTKILQYMPSKGLVALAIFLIATTLSLSNQMPLPFSELGGMYLVDELDIADLLSERSHDYKNIYAGIRETCKNDDFVEERIVEDGIRLQPESEEFTIFPRNTGDIILVGRFAQTTDELLSRAYIKGERLKNIGPLQTLYLPINNTDFGGWAYAMLRIPASDIVEGKVRMLVGHSFPQGSGPARYFIYQKRHIAYVITETILWNLLLIAVIFLLYTIYTRYLQKDRVLIAILIFSFMMPALFNQYVFGGVEHVADNISQLFQAKIFLKGALWVPAPPSWTFDLVHVINDGTRWYSKYIPGQTILLAIGLFFGVPWLVNPIIGALTVFMTYQIGKSIWGEKQGLLAAAILAVSPFYIVQSASMFRHVPTQLFLAGFILYYIKSENEKTPKNHLISGAFFGMAFFCRLGTTIAISLPFLAYRAYKIIRLPKTRKQDLMIIPPIILCLLLYGVYNLTYTGDPFTSPFGLYSDDDTVGFLEHTMHPSFSSSRHTLSKGIMNLKINLISLSSFYTGSESLLIIFGLIAFKSKKRWDMLLIASILALYIGVTLYYAPSVLLGPRYLYESIFMMSLLLSAALFELPKFNKKSAAIVAIYLLFCSYTFLDYHLYDFSNLRGNNDGMLRAVQREKIKNAIVFTVDDPFRLGFQLNSPLLDTDIVYVRFADDGLNQRIMRENFPEKTCYIYNFTSDELRRCN